MTRDSIPARNESVTLLDNANLSTGGTSYDVTTQVHATFAEVAAKANRVLGLRFSGVDVLCDEIANDAALQTWCIIEVNGAPGLDNYASIGIEQLDRVRGLYKEILQRIGDTIS